MTLFPFLLSISSLFFIIVSQFPLSISPPGRTKWKLTLCTFCATAIFTVESSQVSVQDTVSHCVQASASGAVSLLITQTFWIIQHELLCQDFPQAASIESSQNVAWVPKGQRRKVLPSSVWRVVLCCGSLFPEKWYLFQIAKTLWHLLPL